MFRLVKFAFIITTTLLVACGGGDKPEPASQTYGLGTAITEDEVAAWNIDVGPDGVGLPKGSGTATTGEPVFLAKCAACHGEFGEGMGRFPSLVGDKASLTTDRPSKTVGSYWAHATTLYDYIYRAMPFGNAQSLTAEEVYGITAYILAMNDIIASDEVLDAQTLPKVKMPNSDGFIVATDTDIKVKACMQDCVEDVKVSSRASRNRVSKDAGE